MINYHQKKFRVCSNSDNGEVSNAMIFVYEQEGSIVTCNYSGESIVQGHLMGVVQEDGSIKFSYQQINTKNELRTGKCISTPEILDNGKLRLHEKWQWTNGDLSSGASILEEI